MQNYSNLIKKHRISFLILLALILIGAFIRSYQTIFGDQILLFHADNMGHLGHSGLSSWRDHLNTDLTKIFFNSYTDAHPPLRNILMNLLLQNIDNLYYSRLIGFVPGLILIPVSFIFGYRISNKSSTTHRVLIGLIFAFVITFMEQTVYLSFSTRPYMLMSLFQFVSVICLIKYFREPKSRTSLVNFFLFASLAIFTNYSVAISIFSLCLALVIFMIRNKSTNKSLPIIGISLLAGIMVFQVVQLKKHSPLTKFSKLQWLKHRYINTVKEMPAYAIKSTDIFFKSQTLETNAKLLPPYVLVAFVLYLIGLVVLFRNRQYELFAIALLPLILGLILARLKLYPFWINSHCLYLAPSFLIAYYYAFELLFKARFLLSPQFISIIICISYLFSLDMFKVPLTQYHKRFTQIKRSVRYSKYTENDFESISKELSKIYEPGTFIFTDRFFNMRLQRYFKIKKIEKIVKPDSQNLVSWDFEAKKDFCADLNIINNANECDFIKNITKYHSVIIVGDTESTQLIKSELAKYHYTKETSQDSSRHWSIEKLEKE